MENLPKKYWFKAKRYGYGWYPSSWQGWAVTIFSILLVVSETATVDEKTNSVTDIIFGVSLPIIGIVVLLILICYLTGEKPRWRWGKD